MVTDAEQRGMQITVGKTLGYRVGRYLKEVTELDEAAQLLECN